VSRSTAGAAGALAGGCAAAGLPPIIRRSTLLP
jgi:hypothetical protein